MNDRQRMPIGEFVSEGYLQELNRRFLHPLGLALEVVLDEHGNPFAFGGVWDHREDPEGVCYAEGVIDNSKASRIARLERMRISDRLDRLGYWIQTE